MFELLATRTRGALLTTRLLGRQIYRIVKKMENEQLKEQVEQFLANEGSFESAGDVDAVETNLKTALRFIKKGDELDSQLEQKITLFILRNMQYITDDMTAFAQLERELLPKVTLEQKAQVMEIIKFFKKEQEQIFDSVLAIARMSRDQFNQNARLRDETFNVFADMQVKSKANMLRKLFKDNKSISEHEEKIIVHLKKLLHHNTATEQEITVALHELAKDMKKEDGVIRTLFASITLIMKIGIRMYFNLQIEEGKLKKTLEHLKEERYPESHRKALLEEIEKIDAHVKDGSTKNMHLLYQLLHTLENKQEGAVNQQKEQHKRGE